MSFPADDKTDEKIFWAAFRALWVVLMLGQTLLSVLSKDGNQAMGKKPPPKN